MKNKLLMAMVALLLVSGCVSAAGNPKIANKELIHQIEEGVTTKKEVVKIFGYGDKSKQKGYEIWTYTYMDGFFVLWPRFTSHALILAFDKQGKVIDLQSASTKK